MKFVVIIILLLINARETSSMMNLTLINNARFDSMNLLDDLWDIPTRDRCICQCDARPNCILVNYNGFHQECQLFSALLQSEKLRVVPINENAAVIVFNYRNQIVTSTVYQTTSTSTTTTTTAEQCTTSTNPLYTYRHSPRNTYIEEIFSYQPSFTGTAILEFGFRATASRFWYLDDVSIVDTNASNSEMLGNGNFELGFLQNWQVACSSTNCRSAGGSIDQSNCKTGSYCYKGACRNEYDFLRQSFNVINRHVYRLTYWIKTIGDLDNDGYINIQQG